MNLEEERRLSRERRAKRGESVPVVEPGPAGRILGAEHTRAVEPYVRQLRQELFGSTEPPWDGPDNPEAGAWTGGWQQRALDGKQTPGDRLLDSAAREISEGTGFAELDVVHWVLFGTRPTLHRAIHEVQFIKKRLPDGTVLRRQYQVLHLNAPITEREIIRVWRERLRGFWDTSSARDALRIRTPLFTELDYHLDALVERTPDLTWAERAEEWRRSPPEGWATEEWRTSQGGATANTLRVRYHRLNVKREKLNRGEA